MHIVLFCILHDNTTGKIESCISKSHEFGGSQLNTQAINSSA